MGTVINFTAVLNERRAACAAAARDAAHDAANKERIRTAAKSGLALGDLLGKSAEESANAAIRLASFEAERIEQEEREATSQYMPAYCDPDNEYRGSKYDATSNLSMAEIVSRIREDIKAAKKAGALPKDLRTTVSRRNYNVITINIRALPGGMRKYTEDYMLASRNLTQPANRYSGFYSDAFTPEYKAMKEKLESIMSAYNRDNSDIMTDYFDRRFYDYVETTYELDQLIKEVEAVSLEDGE